MITNGEARLQLGHGFELVMLGEQLVKSDKTYELTRIEFRLLYFLSVHLNQPVSHQELLDFVWSHQGFISKNELYVYICKLRMLIEENPRLPKYLKSIRGYGYILSPPC